MSPIAASSAPQQHALLQATQVVAARRSEQQSHTVAQQALALIQSVAVPPMAEHRGQHVDTYA
jgi:hypothetical protein